MPLALGAGLALYLYPGFAGPNVSFPPFALFLGAAMSITALPVLARILSEQELLHSRVGTLAIACAAVDDVTGWCILAYISFLIRASRSAAPVLLTVAGALTFALLMILVVRPVLVRFVGRFDHGQAGDGIIVRIVLFLLMSSLATEFLGIHLLLGSFLAGAVMPKTGSVMAYIRVRLEPFCLTLCLSFSD